MSQAYFCETCKSVIQNLDHICQENNVSDMIEEVEEFQNQEAYDVDELLIAEVSKRPQLYDMRLPVSQRSKLKLQDLWSEIHNKFKDHMTLQQIKDRWRTIRDRYVRMKNTKYVPSGSAASSRPKPSAYKYDTLLKFLDDTITKKKTISNLAFTSNSGFSDESRASTPEESFNTPTSSKKRKTLETGSLETELLKKLREPAVKIHDQDQLDDVDHFCKSLAHGFRQLEYRKRLKLQVKCMELLDELLSEAE